MNCGNCGRIGQVGARFCEGCGNPVARRCPSCQGEVAGDASFCGSCGAALTSGQGSQPPLDVAAPQLPSRARASRQLADKLLRSKSSAEGERKQVTVLFADVKGSMDLAELMDPEVWSQIMRRFFTILAEGVERFEGFVDKFTGDGIMALFGAPLAHEDHVQRACYAALSLRDAARAYAGEVRARHGVPFEVRIGLNSGEVVVGTVGMVGEDLRMDFTAQGHVVGVRSAGRAGFS